MPQNLSPEQYLYEMAVDFNKAVNSKQFDKFVEFTKISPGAPDVGSFYTIDLPGPDDGNVMIIEMTSSSFIFQVVDSPDLFRIPTPKMAYENLVL